MKKLFSWIVTILLVTSMIFCVVGCNDPAPEPQAPQDSTDTGNSSSGGNTDTGNSGSGGNTDTGNSGSGGNTDTGNSGNESGDNNSQNYKYSKDLWGKWKRIDNGDIYTISGDSITTNSWNYGNLNSCVINKEGENIITLENGSETYRLFRTGGGTRTFTAKVAGFQNIVSRASDDTQLVGKGGVTVTRKSKDIISDTDTQVSASDGTITFEDVVADEVQVITVETENGNTIEVELKPSYDGEDVGTIPIVESGYSFKTSYTIGEYEGWSDNQQFYNFGNDFKEYNLTLRFTNIGDGTCSTATYELLYNDPQLKLSQTSGAISSIGAGNSRDVNVKVSYGTLDEYYKDVTIGIKITDSKLRKTWLDSITLRFYQTPIYLNMYAYNVNKSGNLNGFVICPDGRADYFNTWHDNQMYKLVPYNKDGNNDYTVVFSATSESDEMAYTLNAYHTNNGWSQRFDFDKFFASESGSSLFEFIYSYEDGQGNNTEDTAIEVEEPLDFVKSYVQWGDVDYFKLDLNDVLFARISEFKIPKAGLGATADSVCAVVKGKNFKSPLENVNFTCSSNFIVSDINKQIIDDNTMYVDLQIPQNAKHFEVTANSEVDEVASIFEVNEYDVRTGDYVLKDNRIVRQEYITELTDKEKEKIFGVITLKDSGEPVILGLQKGESLKWAPENITGFNTLFTAIVANVTGYEYDNATGKYTGHIFTGDLDGSDNWEEICKIDPEGTKDAATNYPAFNFANTYGTTAELTGTDFETGWYVPSVKELFDIYENITHLQTSLDVVGGYKFSSDWHLSSSLYGLDYNWAPYVLGLGDGNVSCWWDNFNVLLLHTFNSELFTNYEYADSTITSVEIPIAGEGYTGDLPVKIYGENLKGNEITCEDGTFANVTYVDNSTATATITCTGIVGESTITVMCGSSSATGTVKVVEAEKCFTVGDILFTDGTIIKADKVKYGVPDEQLSKAFAVIGSAPYNGGTGLGVGLKTKSCAWAPENTTGYKTKFTGITTEVSFLEYEGYKFSGDLDGFDNWEEICKIDPEGTKDAVTNYPAFNFANNYGTIAGLTGTDFETGWYVPSIKELFDVYENKDFTQTSLDVVNGITFGESYWSSSQVASNNYCVYLVSFSSDYVFSYDKFSNDKDVLVCQSFLSEQFTNYEYVEATITRVEILVAGEGYTGELPVKIYGENLKGNEITCDDVTFANVTYVDNSTATATIKCTGIVGESTIIVMCGSSSATGTVKVVETEKCFTVGDILFTDGTIIKADKVKYGIPDEQLSKAFAVIGSAPYNGGTGLGVGLKTKSCVWAPRNTTGYKTKFTGITTEVSGSQYDEETQTYYGYKFSGDLDGSDNWDYICSVDPKGTKDAVTNYPAFNFANNYGTTAGLTGTDFETGWYVPSIKELYDVYENKDFTQSSLDVVNGITLKESYWSSSQNSAYYYYACKVQFYNGAVDDYSDKCYNSDVFVLHAFNSEQFTNYEYAETTITSVVIPIAGEGYTGDLPVKIYGENLKGNEITCDDVTFANVTYIDNSSVAATITCTGFVGESTIIVKCGSSSATGTVKVVETEKCFTVGDILFTDGTIIKADKVKYGVPDELLSKAFAVIGSAPYNGGTGLGVGFKTKSCVWAPENTTGYKTNFTGIITECFLVEYETYYDIKFSGDLDGSDNWDYICRVDPEGTKDAVTNYPAFNFANNYGTIAGLTGTDFETGWYVPSIKELYDVYENKDFTQSSLDVVNGITLEECYWSSSQIASNNYYVYLVDFDNGDSDIITGVKKYNNNVFVLQAFSPEQFTNYEYAEVTITSVEILVAGEGYTGELPVKIYGENLKGNEITCDDVTFANVKYITDTSATATITCTGFVGETLIKVKCGSSSVTGTVKVVETEKCFSVGDIILADGSRVKVADVATYEIDYANTPIAVIGSAPYNGGTGLGVGLETQYYVWAPENTTGYKTKFTGIITEVSGEQYDEETRTYYGYKFSGDLDGSDNWDYICSVDPEGTQDAAINYPAFNFALTYGETAGLTGTDYADGWYVPSVKELYDVYENKDFTQSSLDVVNGITLKESYWSSSQNSAYYYYACKVQFYNGAVADYSNKCYNYDVLVVRAFNAN